MIAYPQNGISATKLSFSSRAGRLTIGRRLTTCPTLRRSRTVLPHHPHVELHNSRGAAGGCDFAESRRCEIDRWTVEHHPIERTERIHLKCELDALVDGKLPPQSGAGAVGVQITK